MLHQFRNNHDTSIANLFFVCTKENSLLQLRKQLWISAIEGHPFDNQTIFLIISCKYIFYVFPRYLTPSSLNPLWLLLDLFVMCHVFYVFLRFKSKPNQTKPNQTKVKIVDRNRSAPTFTGLCINFYFDIQVL